MPARFCTDCGQLYTISDQAPGLRCPAHHAAALERARARKNARPRGNTTTRGYGTAHRRELARQLAAFQPGQPCAIGGEPLTSTQKLDLAHNQDRTGWLGLACWSHNRGHA